jgi:hypothetical protein
MIGVFSQLESPRLVAVYRVGIGWQFAVDSDKAKFSEITGLASDNSGALAGLANTDDQLPIDTATAIGLIDLAMRQSKVAVVCVVDRAELVCANATYGTMSPSDKAVLSILQALAADASVADTRNLLILVTDTLSDLHSSLRLASSRFYAIQIVPPDYNERLEIARQVLTQLETTHNCQLEISAEQFAQATSMMTRYGLLDVLLDAKQSGKLTKAQVRTVKAQVMSQEYGDILEPLDPIESGWRGVAGMAQLKAYFDTIVADMLSGNLSDVPAGILCAGAAGLGKTHFMRCVAGETGLPVINLNIGRILGSLVGESEGNLERALTAIRGAAPCMVVLDEIETTFPDRSTQGAQGDSGIGQRILKRMLEELSNADNRGRVVWIGITNFPQKLDAALSRAGRFDITVAFLPPTESERVALVELYCAKYDMLIPSQKSLLDHAGKLAGYTNAEIENVVRKARQICVDRWQDGQVSLAITDAISRVRANTRDVQVMTLNALAAVNDSDLLPDAYIDQWRNVTGQVSTATTQKSETRKSLF